MTCCLGDEAEWENALPEPAVAEAITDEEIFQRGTTSSIPSDPGRNHYIIAVKNYGTEEITQNGPILSMNIRRLLAVNIIQISV